MLHNNSLGRSFVGLALALAGGQAVHWLITPQANASALRTFAVAVQSVVCLGGVAWVARRERMARRSTKQPLP
jgi:hypothetical protein